MRIADGTALFLHFEGNLISQHRTLNMDAGKRLGHME
jgi:hypothetical protein